MPAVAGALLVLLLPVALVVLPLDALLRLRLPRDARVVREIATPTKNGHRLFVLLPAAQVETSILTKWTAEVFESYGDVCSLDSGRKRFVASKLINLAIRQAKGYKEVVLVAHSFSLLLAYDIAAQMRSDGDTRSIKVISMDGLSHKHFTRGGKLLWLAKLLPIGPILNLLSRLVWAVTFRPHAPTAKAFDRVLLRELHRSYRSHLLSTFTDVLRYISGHPMMRCLNDVTCEWVVSGQDVVVKSGSHLDCIGRGIFQGNRIHRVKEAGHLEFHDWPAAYREALTPMLETTFKH